MFQVPEYVLPRPDGNSAAEESNIRFEYTEEPFSFSILRKDSDEVLFDTSAASLIFESQYLRLRTSLPDDPYLYGLGKQNTLSLGPQPKSQLTDPSRRAYR